MILTDREIKIALHKRQIEIDPLPKEEAFSSTAVDLTIADAARVFKASISSGLTLDPGSSNFLFHGIIDTITDQISTDPHYTLNNKDMILAWTNENVRLPDTSRIAARVEGKSSLARLGIGVHITAPTIHAGFNGQLQLEIVNHGPAPVILRSGMRICQLIIETTLGSPEKGYSGIFSGQKSP